MGKRLLDISMDTSKGTKELPMTVNVGIGVGIVIEVADDLVKIKNRSRKQS